jgi:hypothetical protein
MKIKELKLIVMNQVILGKMIRNLDRKNKGLKSNLETMLNNINKYIADSKEELKLLDKEKNNK